MFFSYKQIFNQFLLILVFTLFLFGFLFGNILHAEIVTDGSAGSKMQIKGPDYSITQQLGTTAGDNLYHSFQSFNLKNHESAEID